MPNLPNRLVAAQKRFEEQRKLAAKRGTEIAFLKARLENPVALAELEVQREMNAEMRQELEKLRRDREELRQRLIKSEENIRVLESYFADYVQPEKD